MAATHSPRLWPDKAKEPHPLLTLRATTAHLRFGYGPYDPKEVAGPCRALPRRACARAGSPVSIIHPKGGHNDESTPASGSCKFLEHGRAGAGIADGIAS